MPASFQRQCLLCGMTVTVPVPDLHERPVCYCPKCDSELFSQAEPATLSEDIAHQGETVAQAMAKLERVLNEALAGYYRDVRLITGGGLIRDEALGHLHYLQRQNRILSFHEEGRNRGAVLVRLRQ